jgi:transposase
MPAHFRVSSLVPGGLIVENVTQVDGTIVVTARAGIQVATCPLCGSPSRRVHSRYVRQVSDLPCSGRGVFLRVVTGRFCCSLGRRRLIVDCEASGAPLSGKRPTATFMSGSCRSRSRSMASLWPQAIAETRAITISNTACRIRLGSRRSAVASAIRLQMPSLRSACRSNSRPPFEDWLPPSKSIVSFLRRTADRSNGSGVSSVMAAVALG